MATNPSMPTTHFSSAAISVVQREVLRCDHCTLIQFRTRNDLCRKCKRPFPADEDLFEVLSPPPTEIKRPAIEHELDAGAALSDLRKSRHLSQRQLAERMGVPRTYISKIENKKAIPTLGSIESFAKALEVEMSDFIARMSRADFERERRVRALLSDPFMEQLLPYIGSLNKIQEFQVINFLKTKTPRHAIQ